MKKQNSRADVMTRNETKTAEAIRLQEDAARAKNWKRWGPYLSERQWGTAREENRRRGRTEPEFELVDSGLFDDNRYFDVFAEYVKHSPNDILIRITVANRGPEAATLHLLPTLWFRNTWSWGCTHEGCSLKPRIRRHKDANLLEATHETLGKFFLAVGPAEDRSFPPFLFTENES